MVLNAKGSFQQHTAHCTYQNAHAIISSEESCASLLQQKSEMHFVAP